ncbi:hypothetical protein PDIG_08020 [Penicillium digitatum PHI26]|uniref:Major facilitator superfamily (MFS) profile domain-containing protein n=2 Tax=Penicillium digitatum TaxID=36651 RepID=K9GV48_PEND2|nr:hypothetical protein PDIP_36060 [Penicillium digitatum Pd1]EKV16402.1 hypothetical protein PDIP_36060 [Penicillium digitatum Pd1]EKV18488.1 hypothetical protein PDIG_08020 [Penicillium digitatum PHI26]
MGYTTLWKRLSPRQLNGAIQIFSLISIFFEGYDQGVMGGVNSAPKYVTEVGIGRPDGTVTDTTHQGGLVSVYYLGAIFGCFAGGWLADRVGRINGLLAGSSFALIGGALQAAAQDSNFMLCARVVTGIGTGGISIAYWISFGLAFVDDGYSDVRWRFLLAFQCFPALILVAFIKLLPDSPRYLASVGRNDEARDLLSRIRKDWATQDDIDREYLEIIITAEGNKRSSPFEFVKILFGKGGKPGLNLGRRAWLCVWLQIMASWTGITAGAVYEGSLHNPEKASQYAPGAVTMLFLFNLGYAATWGTVAFLIPTEIFPSDLRAQGNGFGITGWAIGVGMTTLVNPIMFNVMTSRTYFLFAGLNLTWIPIVYLFYPETRNRSLESIDALFSTTSPFYWKMEQAYKLHGDVLAEHGVNRSEDGSDGKTELTTTPSKRETVQTLHPPFLSQ